MIPAAIVTGKVIKAGVRMLLGRWCRVQLRQRVAAAVFEYAFMMAWLCGGLAIMNMLMLALVLVVNGVGWRVSATLWRDVGPLSGGVPGALSSRQGTPVTLAQHGLLADALLILRNCHPTTPTDHSLITSRNLTLRWGCWSCGGDCNSPCAVAWLSAC